MEVGKIDWPRARTILLAAFTVVNLILAYSIWGPSGIFPGPAGASPADQQAKLRATLLDLQLTLPASVIVPKTPNPMQFLKVEHRRTPDNLLLPGEFSQGMPSLKPPIVNKETNELIYRLGAVGSAAREINLENHRQAQDTVEAYLSQVGLLPESAKLLGFQPSPEPGHLVLEYVPVFNGVPVFSGHLLVDISSHGLETVREFWVVPRGFTDAPPKAVRPAGEALLRLAGRLQGEGKGHRTIREIQLGYYAGSLLLTQSDVVNGWDTVPVWRITLDAGEVYYINAFNGEWES